MKKSGMSPKMQKELDKLLLDGAANGSRIKVSQALEKGANPNGKDESNWTALHVASYFKNAKICKLLIESGANVNAKTADGATPLLIAASVGALDVSELLLKESANANAEDCIGLTPLMGAADCGSLEIANLLMEWGADPHAKSRDKSAMDFAIRNNVPEVAAAIEAQMIQRDMNQSPAKRRARAM